MAIIRNYSEASEESSSSGYSRKINKKMDILDRKIDSLYKDIYVSRPDNRSNLNNVLDRLDNALDSLQDENDSVSGMSELLRRIENESGVNSSKLMGSVEELFNDQNLVNTLFANQDIHKYISAQNYQYDMICKYLPKLQDALEIKRDNVLCSDNFSKQFINPISNKSSKKEVEQFSANCDKLEKIYEISKFLEKTYMDTRKYGESFVYRVPYSVAMKRLLKRANKSKNGFRLGQMSFYESSEQCVGESYTTSKEYIKMKKYISESIDLDDPSNKFTGNKVTLLFNNTGLINESVNECLVLESKQELEAFRSLSAVYESNYLVESDVTGDLSKQMEEVKNSNNKIASAISNDGLIIPSNLDLDPDKIKKDINGCVLERLPRENIVPVYIGKKCMGYYYFEFAEDKNACGFCGSNHMTPGVGNGINYTKQNTEDQQEMALRFIANRMSQSIDSHFINANKDLKEEIYSVLRYNEKFDISRSNDIGVTFIPAEDITHCYFEFDENTHRGISDLEKSVIPAMLYILLYLTDIIGKITRSTDKRIYYVKQNVETNVARTMMNVVQQIKKGNMGMRQIESMNNILNIVGKYNDYIIPMGQSGDPPISFEVMNGQDIQTPTEIMEKMEEAAVNPIIPFEFVNATMQVDFASRFTMSNTRFLKSVFTEQRHTERFFSDIYTKVYNYEFNENNSQIKVILPPPVYLIMTNNQQLMDNVSQQADKIIEIEMSNEEDEIKNEFKKIYIRHNLSAYYDFDQIDRFKEMAKVNVESDKPPAVEESDDNPEDMMDDEY